MSFVCEPRPGGGRGRCPGSWRKLSPSGLPLPSEARRSFPWSPLSDIALAVQFLSQENERLREENRRLSVKVGRLIQFVKGGKGGEGRERRGREEEEGRKDSSPLR